MAVHSTDALLTLLSALKKNYKIKVTNTLKLDLQVWTNFLKHYNGASFINPQYLDKKIIQLFKDSAGVENGLFWW